MGENHPTEYFTVFEGTYSKDCPINRRPPVLRPKTSTKGKATLTLALLLLGVSTAVAAFTASHRGNVTGPTWGQSATFVSLPGIATVEDALY